jgi:ribosomal protein S18 acetylase RimI-like enzyme
MECLRSKWSLAKIGAGVQEYYRLQNRVLREACRYSNIQASEGSSMTITIRLAGDEDIPAMAQIRSDERGEHGFWMDRITRYKHGEHSPQQALPERAIFVAIDEGNVVGFAAGHRTQRLDCEGELQWINVAAEKRGMGIADRLVAQMGAWFVEQNAHRVCVNVGPDNVAARRLYARCGARLLDEHWMVWDEAQSMGGK